MRTRRPIARTLLAALFLISATNQIVQIPGEFFGVRGVRALGAFHLCAGITGLATAWGAWRATRWAWAAALAWGVATGALILSLEPLLDLSPADAAGFPAAVAIVGVIAAAAAWYLWRAARRPAPETPAGNAATAP